MSTLVAVLDVLGALLLLAGGVMCLAGAVGLNRFPDTLSRLHAVTKPQTFGLVLTLAGMALTLRTWAALTTLLVAGVTQLLTSPVSAHMAGRTAYRLGLVRHDVTSPDQLAADLARREED